MNTDKDTLAALVTVGRIARLAALEEDGSSFTAGMLHGQTCAYFDAFTSLYGGNFPEDWDAWETAVETLGYFKPQYREQIVKDAIAHLQAEEYVAVSNDGYPVKQEA